MEPCGTWCEVSGSCPKPGENTQHFTNKPSKTSPETFLSPTILPNFTGGRRSVRTAADPPMQPEEALKLLKEQSGWVEVGFFGFLGWLFSSIFFLGVFVFLGVCMCLFFLFSPLFCGPGFSDFFFSCLSFFAKPVGGCF